MAARGAVVLVSLFLLVTKGTGSQQPRIVIVGAGVAGVGAAVRLIDRGFTQIKILEAEDRIGGRIHSVPFGPWTVDLGSETIHDGPDSAVYQMAAPLGLIEDATDGGNMTIVFSDGEYYDKGYISLLPTDHDITTLRNVSLYHALLNSTKEVVYDIVEEKHVDAYADLLLKLECAWEGCDTLEDVSAALINTNDTQSYGWKGKGYATLFDLILRRHEKSKGQAVKLEDKLFLKKEVKKIRVEEKEVVVECSDGTEEKADVVLVTVSVGVLKAGVDSLFQPPLPQAKRAAIHAIGLGTVDKIILRFADLWWPYNTKGFELVWMPEDKKVLPGETSWEKELLVFDLVDRSALSLTTWVLGDAAREMEKTPLPEVQAACMRVLNRFFSPLYNVTPPLEIVRSKWGSNPHFRGSYSYRRIEAEAVDVSKIAEPLTNSKGKQVVFFAGEATHKDYYGTVHGALETGWREADRIASIYRH